MSFIRRALKVWFSANSALAVLFCLCMIAGYLWSRALLSISVVLIFANSLHPALLRRQWQQWKMDFFSIACFLFFVAYVISGIWSSDVHQWWNSVTNKLPFSVLPFAFLSLPLKQLKWQKIIVWFLIMAHLIIVCYSMGALFANFDYYVQSYNISHSLPTTIYDDHIRFSLSLVGTLIIMGYYLFENKSLLLNKMECWLLGIVSIVFIIYLHILASKTGLLTLYIFLFLFALYLLKKKNKFRKYFFPLLALVIVLPISLYFVLPTFREKINYVRYEWHMVTTNDTLYYNLSDAGRVISYKMAAKVVEQHKWLGTGAGDIMHEMDTVYQQYFPEIPQANHLIPHNQYLFDFTALGIFFGFSLIILCIASFLFFPAPIFYGRITSALMMVAMMAEAMLEIQFGVFIFLFFLLFWRNVPTRSKDSGLILYEE